MQGIPHFNFPAFHAACAQLEQEGHEVFNPARRDEAIYGTAIGESPTGDIKDVAHLDFSLREALEADMSWICRNAEVIALLPGWETSKGAKAEKALADALGLEVRYL